MPELFTEPTAFNPYRWEKCTPGPFEYSPFSSGPRTCIGAAFAMTEIKVVLAILLPRYRLEFIPGTRVDRFVSITLSVKDRLNMRINRQDRHFHRGVGGVLGNVREMVTLSRADADCRL
jgi:cytochrome P450